MEASKILINNIKGELPTILLKKFEAFGIKNLEEVLSINLEEFGNRRGVGVTVLQKLSKLKEQIRNDLERFADIQAQAIKIHKLPINETTISTSNFLELALEVVNDFLILLPKQEHRGIINHLYGLNMVDKSGLNNLSQKYGLSQERIRQLKILLLDDLRKIFNGKFNIALRCHVRQSIFEDFSEIQKYFSKKRVFYYDFLVETFRDKYSCENVKNNIAIINLLIEVFGFSRCKKIESIFTKADLVVADPENKKTFLKAADKSLSLLMERITPINDLQIIKTVKRTNKSIQNIHIMDALNLLPEIEALEMEEQTFYQVKFEYLANTRDRAYRILMEMGNPMYIKDIITEVNHRLAQTGSSKRYNSNIINLGSDRRFIPIARTGYWTLKRWNKNIDKSKYLRKNSR